jgi:photosystem II stability/assembly factor-like uncharacterized protein
MSKHICKFLFCFVLVFIMGCSGFSGEPDSSSAKSPSGQVPVTGEHLFGIGAWGENHAWIVGFEGTIVHTSNGGLTWGQQKSPEPVDLYDACFADSKTGWIVGKLGTILHTENAGETWIKQRSNSAERLFAVHFLDTKNGWVSGTHSTILHTTNGGESWVTQGSGEDRYLNDVFFIDEKNGWVVGEYGFISHTEDGGAQWTVQECKDIIPEVPEKEFPPPLPHLYGVYFTDAHTGWVTGMDGIILKTDDGGQNWRRLVTGMDRALFKITMQKDKGMAVGERGQYLLSTDGGNSWNAQKGVLKTRFWLRDIKFTDTSNGWIVGQFGTILHTDNGGATWKPISGIVIQNDGG